jgi:hypothetical protein
VEADQKTLAEARSSFQIVLRLSGAEGLRLFWLMPEEFFDFTTPVGRRSFYEFG